MSNDLDAELHRKYRSAVDALPRKQREIFLAHRLQDMPYDEIARRTGLSIRQVERQMARAMYKLVKQMEGEPLSWWERWL
jgi:RNA polymerase sigma-70 factor (ECF subfamily)